MRYRGVDESQDEVDPIQSNNNDRDEEGLIQGPERHFALVLNGVLHSDIKSDDNQENAL